MTEISTHQQDILSGIQSAWISLYAMVNALKEGEIKDLFLCHLTDCLSWDSTHDFPVMEKTLDRLSLLVSQYQIKDAIAYWIERIRTLLSELLLTLDSGMR